MANPKSPCENPTRTNPREKTNLVPSFFLVYSFILTFDIVLSFENKNWGPIPPNLGNFRDTILCDLIILQSYCLMEPNLLLLWVFYTSALGKMTSNYVLKKLLAQDM